MAMLPEVYTAS